MKPMTQFVTSPGSRFVAVYYVFTIALGMFVLLFHGRLAFAIDLIAVAFYLAMTGVFYDFSKKVTHRNRSARRN